MFILCLSFFIATVKKRTVCIFVSDNELFANLKGEKRAFLKTQEIILKIKHVEKVRNIKYLNFTY